MEKNLRTLVSASLLGCVAVLLSLPAQSQSSGPEFFLSQYRHELEGLSNPQATYMRVLDTWSRLRDYSHRSYPIYASQNFNGGTSTRQGVLLDISIAADPSRSVTQFLLAHEWGHMVHGDPFTGVSDSAEDRADAYAAGFMRHWAFDIRPAMEFLCDLPEGGPLDTHSPGKERAGNLAQAYGYESWIPACVDANDEKALLVREIKALANASLQRFAHSRTVNAPAMSDHYLTIPITVSGRDATCRPWLDDLDEVVCKIRFEDESWETDDATTAFDLLAEAVTDALPNWKRTDKEDDDTSADDAHHWRKVADDSDAGEIKLILSTSRRSGKQSLSLNFRRPSPPEVAQ